MEPAQKPLEARDNLEASDVGSIWEHTRTGNLYEILELVNLKDPQDGNWYQGVKYNSLENSSELCYVRYETDFLSKFKPVPKEIEHGSNEA